MHREAGRQREEKRIDMPCAGVGGSCKEMLIISKIKINEIGHKNSIDLAQCVGAPQVQSFSPATDHIGSYRIGMDWNWNRRCLQTCAT